MKSSLFILTALLIIEFSNTACPNLPSESEDRIIFDLCENAIIQTQNRQNNNYKYIICRNDTLTTIQKSILKIFKNAIIVCLNGNKIKEIDSDAFHETKKLEEIHLKNNEINGIMSGTFNSLPSLRILDLSGNFLPIIQKDVLHHLNNLNDLRLSNNFLEYFDFSVLFRPLTNLNLSSNNLNDIDNWVSLKNVEVVDLRYNNIPKISNIGSGVIYLYLGWNKLQYLPAHVFAKSEQLNELDLSHNLISNIHPNAFRHLNKLEYLYLNNNELKSLENNVFKDLISLKYLYLSNNILAFIDSDALKGMRRLTELFLDYNALDRIRENCFQDLRHLVYLDLHNNKLKHINTEKLLNFTRLERINLKNNEWVCESLVTAVEILKKSNVEIIENDEYSVLNIHGITCTVHKMVEVNFFIDQCQRD